jgi:hypothetical protein
MNELETEIIFGFQCMKCSVLYKQNYIRLNVCRCYPWASTNHSITYRTGNEHGKKRENVRVQHLIYIKKIRFPVEFVTGVRKFYVDLRLRYSSNGLTLTSDLGDIGSVPSDFI